MSEPTPQTASVQAARRKLVRGAFAVPAVMTLASGSPAAATSLSCVQRQVNSPISTPNGQVPDGMNLIRIPYFKESAGTRFFFTGAEAHAKVFPGRSVLPIANIVGSAGWQEVIVSGTGDCTTGAHTYSAPSLSSTASGHLVVRYNEFGDIVGIGKGTTGTAIGGSCWVSVVSAA